MSASVPDMAAKVAAKYNEARAAISALRQHDRQGDWTTFQIMLDEAMGIARDGLRNSHTMMDRVRQMAQEAAKLPVSGDA